MGKCRCGARRTWRTYGTDVLSDEYVPIESVVDFHVDERSIIAGLFHSALADCSGVPLCLSFFLLSH